MKQPRKYLSLLVFFKCVLEGNLSRVSKIPPFASLQVHMNKLSSHFASFGPGCVFYLQSRWKETTNSCYFQIFALLKPVMEFSCCRALPKINLYIAAIEIIGSLKIKVNLPSHRLLLTCGPPAWRNRMHESFYKDLKIQEEIWHSVQTSIATVMGGNS